MAFWNKTNLIFLISIAVVLIAACQSKDLGVWFMAIGTISVFVRIWWVIYH